MKTLLSTIVAFFAAVLIHAQATTGGVVKNIEALRAFPCTTSRNTTADIEVTGYSTYGDGGQGTFVWDAKSTAPDDGGITIQPNGAPIGRWIRQFAGPLNIKWFGAKGNGITDDTASLTAALRYLDCHGGGTLYLPISNYLIAHHNAAPSAIQINTSNIHIIGDGPGATIVTDTVASAGGNLFGFGQGLPNLDTLPVYSIESASFQSTSITLSTISEISHFAVGDFIFIRGSPTPTGDGIPVTEINIITSLNPSTGVIRIKFPLSKSYLNDGTNPFGAVDVQRFIASNNSIANLRIDCLGDVPVVGYNQYHFQLSNLICTVTAAPSMKKWTSAGVPVLNISPGRSIEILNCKFYQINSTSDNQGIWQIANGTVDVLMQGCECWTDGGPPIQATESTAQVVFQNDRFGGSGGIVLTNAYDIAFVGCYANLNTPYHPSPSVYLRAAVWIGQDGHPCRRLSFTGCNFCFSNPETECFCLNATNIIFVGNVLTTNCGTMAASAPIFDVGGASGGGSNYDCSKDVFLANTIISENSSAPEVFNVCGKTHDVIISENAITLNNSRFLRIQDSGQQLAGITVEGNVVTGMADRGVFFASVGHERPYFWQNNNLVAVTGYAYAQDSIPTSSASVSSEQFVLPGGRNAMFKTIDGISNAAGSKTATLFNAPSGGNPSTWIPFVIDGTGGIKYVPAW